jgi:hypothetical protein
MIQAGAAESRIAAVPHDFPFAWAATVTVVENQICHFWGAKYTPSWLIRPWDGLMFQVAPPASHVNAQLSPPLSVTLAG